MNLLRFDLQALLNLLLHGTGRRVAVSGSIGLVLLGALSYWFARTVLEHPSLLAAIHRHTAGDEVHGLLGYGLMACPLVATWLGLAQAQRQLFETPELLLWRTAPIAGWRGPVQVLLRAGFTTALWAGALAGPFVVAILQQRAAPPFAYALLPLAVVGASLPLLAVFLAIQLVLVRFFAGRWLRLCTAVIGALASVGFSTWLLLSLLTSPQQRAREVEAIAGAPDRLPWTVDVGAELLAAAASGQLATRPLLSLCGWLAATFFAFRLVARLHPGALERHLAAELPIWRAHGRWPGSLAAVMRKKELAQLLQQPGALIGFLVYAVLVFALCKQQVLVSGILANPYLPRPLAETGALLAMWFLAVLLVLYAHMGRLALWDGSQWSLYMSSPAAPFALLRGKLTAVFLFLLWPLVLVGAAGAGLHGARGEVLLGYAGLALGGTLGALGVLAALGTWPLLMRPDTAGQIQPGSKSFVAALLLVLAFEAIAAPVLLGWLWLVDTLQRDDDSALREQLVAAMPAMVLAVAGYGALLLSLGSWLGTRNLRKLLLPV